MRWVQVFLLTVCLNSMLCQHIDIKGSNLLGEILGSITEKLEEQGSGFSLLELIEPILFEWLPILMGQKPFDADGRFEQNREYLMADTSNDEIARTSTEDIITRSGFDVRTHKVTADDGYVTTLYNIINPLADPAALKQPPVMLMHGGTINPAIYVISSAIQHHPEKYPRTSEDGPMTSWNRSLAFALANHGYDVWLVGTRGASPENQGKFKSKKIETAGNKNMSSMELARDSLKYWDYSFDELIQYEVPRQLDKILELTGARNVSLFTYSMSAGPISLPLLASRPDIAKNKIHNYISMAPVLNFDGANAIMKFGAKIVPLIPAKLGTFILTKLLVPRYARDFAVSMSKSKLIRYSVMKFFSGMFVGSSGKYRSLLELPIIGHSLEPISFRQAQHYFQNANSRGFHKYDFGAIKNKLVYGQAKPPAYDVSNIHVKNWMLISAGNDNLGPQSTVKQILKEVNPKPLEHVKAPGFSHIDLIAAFDNDIHMVHPVIKFLDKFAILP